MKTAATIAAVVLPPAALAGVSLAFEGAVANGLLVAAAASFVVGVFAALVARLANGQGLKPALVGMVVGLFLRMTALAVVVAIAMLMPSVDALAAVAGCAVTMVCTLFADAALVAAGLPRTPAVPGALNA